MPKTTKVAVSALPAKDLPGPAYAYQTDKTTSCSVTVVTKPDADQVKLPLPRLGNLRFAS